jgi:hypothetical protein
MKGCDDVNHHLFVESTPRLFIPLFGEKTRSAGVAKRVFSVAGGKCVALNALKNLDFALEVFARDEFDGL